MMDQQAFSSSIFSSTYRGLIAAVALLVVFAGCGDLEEEAPVEQEATDRQAQELFVDFQRYYEPPEEDYFADIEGMTTTPDRLEDGHAPMIIDENVLKFSTYALDHAEVESDALHFPREGFEGLLELSSGDVVISELRRADFWREVTSVEPRADEIVVNTREAEFTQVVLSGDFHIRVESHAPVTDDDFDLMDPYLEPQRVRQLQQQSTMDEIEDVDDEIVDEIMHHQDDDGDYVHYPPNPPRDGIPDNCFSEAFDDMWSEEGSDIIGTDYPQDTMDEWMEVADDYNSWLDGMKGPAWEDHEDIFEDAKVDFSDGDVGSGCYGKTAVPDGTVEADMDDFMGDWKPDDWNTYTQRASNKESYDALKATCDDQKETCEENRSECYSDCEDPNGCGCDSYTCSEDWDECMPDSDNICTDPGECDYQSSSPSSSEWSSPSFDTSDDFQCAKHALYDQFVEDSVRTYYANNTGDLSVEDLDDLDEELDSICDAVDPDGSGDGEELDEDDQGTLASLIETYVIDSLIGTLIPDAFGDFADPEDNSIDKVRDPMCERACQAEGCVADNVNDCYLDALFDEDGELVDDPDNILADPSVYDVSKFEECRNDCIEFEPCIGHGVSLGGSVGSYDGFDFITQSDVLGFGQDVLECNVRDMLGDPECGPDVSDECDDDEVCNDQTGQCEGEDECTTDSDCTGDDGNYCDDGTCYECLNSGHCDESCFGGQCTEGMDAGDHLDTSADLSLQHDVCFEFMDLDLDAKFHYDFGLSISGPSLTKPYPSVDFVVDTVLETDLDMEMLMVFAGGVSFDTSARLDVPIPPPFSFSIGKVGMGFHVHTELSFGISITGETAVRITTDQHTARGLSNSFPIAPPGIVQPSTINMDCYDEDDSEKDKFDDYCSMVDSSEIGTDEAGTTVERGGWKATLSVNAGVAMGINFKMVDPTILDTIKGYAEDMATDALCPTEVVSMPSLADFIDDMTTEIFELEAKLTGAAEFTVAPPDCYYDAGIYLAAWLALEINFPIVSGGINYLWEIFGPVALRQWHGDLLELPEALPIPDDTFSFLEPYCGMPGADPPPPEFEETPTGCNIHDDCIEDDQACAGGTMCVENDGLRATLDWSGPVDLSLVAEAVNTPSSSYNGLYRTADDSALEYFTFWQCGGLCEADDQIELGDDLADDANRYIENVNFEDAGPQDEFAFYVDVNDYDDTVYDPGDVVDYTLEVEYDGDIRTISGPIQIGQSGLDAPVRHGFCIADTTDEMDDRDCLASELQ